jgi:hypothetical protein
MHSGWYRVENAEDFEAPNPIPPLARWGQVKKYICSNTLYASLYSLRKIIQQFVITVELLAVKPDHELSVGGPKSRVFKSRGNHSSSYLGGGDEL